MCHNVTSVTETRGQLCKIDLPKINKVRNISHHQPCEVTAPDGFSYFGIVRPYHTILCCFGESYVNVLPHFFNAVNLTSKIFPSLCPFLPMSSLFLPLTNPSLSLQHISLPLPLSLSPFLGPADCHCYLPNIVWQRRSGIFYWLKIKVAKSPPRSPPLLLAALKNRGKHQFLAHQWRLHNQLKKTLVWGCKSYLCLIRAFRRCMSGFNVMK